MNHYYKNKDAFENQEGVCYVPENPDEDERGYTYDDFLNIARGNEKLAEVIFDLCDWQHPETVFEDMKVEGEVDEDGNILIDTE